MSYPILLAADRQQKIFDMPGFLACGQSGRVIDTLTSTGLMPLPVGSKMFFLPDRHPVAFDRKAGRYTTLKEYFAVAAFLPPGYTLSFTAAYAEGKGAQLLPLYAYAPVVFYKDNFYVPAIRVDRRKVHDINCLEPRALERGIRAFKDSSNRLIQHLVHCATTNFCPNAINFFLGKYEAPLPTSP
ncbi:MAG: radical SAM protein, partial [Spirochaetia bacterium]|nr:radical SAM protein [Spirochaetia bacterium]